MKAVVTGGAGFIGSHLVEGLLERGYRVAVLDDLSTGKLANISHLVEAKRIEFHKGSILDDELLARVFNDTEFVFHEAALARVPRSVAQPLEANEINITGTLKVLLAARDSGVRKLVFASSSSVYGDSNVMPQHEGLIPSPLSPYALNKLAGEHYCSIFKGIYGLDTVALRYFNVYGRRQDLESQYSTVIPAFVDRISRGEAPVIYGDGEQTRDFTFVADVVRANILAAESEASGVYNIGSGRSVSINRLAADIARLMGKDIKPVHQPPRPGDPRHTLSDISRAAGFGYKPGWSLEEGLKDIINSAAKQWNR